MLTKLIIPIQLFLLSIVWLFSNPKVEKYEMSICKNIDNDAIAKVTAIDSEKSYHLPTITKNNKGEVVLYWTEKDDKGSISLYFSLSKDGGKSFLDKQLVYEDAGLGNSRLARPKLLFKKNGEMVAVFSYRTGGGLPARSSTPPAQESTHHLPSTPQAPAARPKRSSEIRFTVSKDGGNTWTSPVSVDSDTSKLTRGFFDAVVLANDEIAIAYLKDVKGSSKFEERDLRLVISKNGVFQPEKLIDPVVCDCCNISLTVDESGALHMVYRDNNNDIRDMSHIVSRDNGTTFSVPQTVYADKWEIKGCPHAGASTASLKNEQYVTWFSGTQNGQAGFRLVNTRGELLKILETSAKNAFIASDDKSVVWIWEQTAANGINSIYYAKIRHGVLLETKKLDDSENAQNPSCLPMNDAILISFEKVSPHTKSRLLTRLIE